MPHWIVDTHVHIGAADGTSVSERIADLWSTSDDGCGATVLLLADTTDSSGLELLRDQDRVTWCPGHDEGVPFLRSESRALVVVQGYQVSTRENIEVLALLTSTRPPANLSMESTLHAVLENGGVPVLPWGVGKWLGERGRVIAELISSEEMVGRIAFADNAHRPSIWPRPSLLRQAERAGFAILNGSDSLPLPGDSRRIGRSGVRLPAGPVVAPVSYLRGTLTKQAGLSIFGKRMSLAGFLYRQTALRLVPRG